MPACLVADGGVRIAAGARSRYPKRQMSAPARRRNVVRILVALTAGIVVGAVALPLTRRAQPSAPAPVEPNVTVGADVHWLKGQVATGNAADERGLDFVITDAAGAQPADREVIALSGIGGVRFDVGNEALWDEALLRGERAWGFPSSRGFVMVEAQKDPASIRAALDRGQFYASTGVLLSRIEEKHGRISLEVAPEAQGEHYFTFLGRGGELLGDRRGRSAAFALEQARGGYVRAVVTDANGKKAWTQPVFVP